MPVTEVCEIIKTRQIAAGVYDISVRSENIAQQAKAGQFIHVVCPGTLLRRPISICAVGDGQLRFVFEIRGRGTAALAKLKEGDSIDILGPLGNGFEFPEGKILVVGGGIGVPPMLCCAKSAEAASAVLGFRSEDKAILLDEFKDVCSDVLVSTDDGSMGYKGTVMPAVEELISRENFAAVFACGPKIMLKSLAKLCEERGISCFVSLEERMGCGVGACLVCSCKIKSDDGFKYKRVCKDGPVFNAQEVCWDE